MGPFAVSAASTSPPPAPSPITTPAVDAPKLEMPKLGPLRVSRVSFPVLDTSQMLDEMFFGPARK